MLAKVMTLLESYSSEGSFFDLIGKQFPKRGAEYNLIQKAYHETMDGFRGILREEGTPYFSHPVAVALIVYEYLRVRNVNAICAALAHDNVEDLKGWSHEQIALNYNQEISELVWWVTKPPIAQYSNSKEARDRAYHANLRRAPRLAIIIKLSDRFHNVMTLWATDPEKRARKIQETQDFYLPLAEDQIILIHEIEKAIMYVPE